MREKWNMIKKTIFLTTGSLTFHFDLNTYLQYFRSNGKELITYVFSSPCPNAHPHALLEKS